MNSFDNIRSLIIKGKIFSAIDAMRKHASSDWEAAGRLETIDRTYSALVNLFISDIPDAGRHQMYDSVKSDLLNLCNRLERLELVKSDPREYYAVARRLKANGMTVGKAIEDAINCQDNVDFSLADSPEGLQMLSAYESAIDNLFTTVWTSPDLSSEDVELLYSEIFARDSNMPEIKLITLAALTLALLQEYDPEKSMLLCRIYHESDSDRVSARALVALILTLACHPVSVAAHSELTTRLNILSLDAEFIAEAKMVTTAMLFARDNDRLNSKFKSEILPEIMKLQPEIMKRLGEMNNTEAAEPEVNPQWEDMIEKSGLADRLKEFNDMQQENGDLMMIPFASLKSHPFFSSAAHWFIPFDIQRSDLASLRAYEFLPLVRLLNSSIFRACDSDKYALAFGLINMPSAQRDMMTSQMNSQLAAIDEDRKTSIDVLLEPSVKDAITFYVRDLYRFYRGYIRRGDFYDPFAKPLNTDSLHVIGEHLADTDNIRFQAEFYFERGYYTEAADLYLRLEDLGETSAVISQKCGYSFQLLGRYAEALEQYSHAELINPDNAWLLRRMAVCYKNLNDSEKAAEYYSKLLAYDSENIKVLLNAGHCMLELNRIDEALTMYYKAHYLDKTGLRALRPLAWCEMLAGNYDKSQGFYQKVLEDNPSSSDYLNAAHLYFITGRFGEALRHYKSSVSMTSTEKFRKGFNDDIPMLRSKGVMPLDITLMMDELEKSSI